MLLKRVPIDFEQQKSYRKLFIGKLKEQAQKTVRVDLNVLIDSSTFNLNSKNNRLKDNEGLGLVFKDRRAKSFGFLLHPCLVYSHLPRKVIGISDVSFITRDPQRKYSKGREWESRMNQ